MGIGPTILHGMLAIITRGTAGGTSGTRIGQSSGCVGRVLFSFPFPFALGCRGCAATARLGSGRTNFVVISIFLVLLGFNRLDDDPIMSVEGPSLCRMSHER